MSRDLFIYYPLSEKESRNSNKIIQSLACQIGSKGLLYDIRPRGEDVFLMISKVPIFSVEKGRVCLARSLQECKFLALNFLKLNFKI